MARSYASTNSVDRSFTNWCFDEQSLKMSETDGLGMPAFRQQPCGLQENAHSALRARKAFTLAKPFRLSWLLVTIISIISLLVSSSTRCRRLANLRRASRSSMDLFRARDFCSSWLTSSPSILIRDREAKWRPSSAFEIPVCRTWILVIFQRKNVFTRATTFFESNRIEIQSRNECGLSLAASLLLDLITELGSYSPV